MRSIDVVIEEYDGQCHYGTVIQCDDGSLLSDDGYPMDYVGDTTIAGWLGHLELVTAEVWRVPGAAWCALRA